ncbi:hypothetical protein [Pedobacter polysacchareus]|uniref:hypothetical protein n=1 Tax=Pedobacter polysacchareus TaxID=2861973 RepID=UPI001C99CC9D|nr:hypothetical protein [Pedobacter polysacchareus]
MKFLLVFSLVLSFFGTSGYIGFSKLQPQKHLTEARWSEQQRSLSRSVHYQTGPSVEISTHVSFLRSSFEHSARLIYAGLLKTKLNQLAEKFKRFKSGTLYQEHFIEFIHHQHTPSIQLISCLFRAYPIN